MSKPVSSECQMVTIINAQVIEVKEKYIRITWPELGCDDGVFISQPLACAFLPRLYEYEWPNFPNLQDEFCIGDYFTLDVCQDENDGQYVPMKIHSIQKRRLDGVTVNAIGLVIGVSRVSDSAIIRSRQVPHDLICSRSNIYICQDQEMANRPACFRSPLEVTVGTVVCFEAKSEQDPEENYDTPYFHCLDVRTYPPSIREAEFRYHYDITGRIIKSQKDNSFWVQFDDHDHDIPKDMLAMGDATMPILENLHSVGGAPLDTFVGEYISCFICPKNPYQCPESDFEVVCMKAVDHSYLWVLPDAEATPSWTQKETVCIGHGILYHRLIQCSMKYNREMEEALRDSLLFMMEHCRPKPFRRLLTKYPHFVEQILKTIT